MPTPTPTPIGAWLERTLIWARTKPGMTMTTMRASNADVRITAASGRSFGSGTRPLPQQKCNPPARSHWPWNGELLRWPPLKPRQPHSPIGPARSRGGEPGPPVALGARRLGLGVADDLLQLGQVVEEATPARGRQAAVCV